MLSHIKYIDLFAGIGGFHQALSSFNAKCIFSSEWDENCKDVYERNYGIRPFGDITKIDEREVPKHDVLCAGFPCQAFSVSGKQLGFADTRGTLFFDVIRIARFRKPKILILENVRNFARHDNGNTIRTVKNTLEEAGYSVCFKVLNASNFGVPQKRDRIFIIALRNDIQCGGFVFPVSSGKQTRLIDFLLPDSETDEYVVNRDDVVMKPQIEAIPNLFGVFPQRPLRIGTVNKGGQGERIYNPMGHAITLSAYGGGVGAKTGLYLVNGRIRRLAPRECARITGFPDSFSISENKNISYKQFGNCVVVNVVKAIIEKIIEAGILTRTIEEIRETTSVR